MKRARPQGPEPGGFDRSVSLPAQLRIAHIRNAIAYIEDQTSEFVDVYHEQANIFSALVGIFGVRALHSLSPYKRHKHPDVAQQRFPDLSLRGKLSPPPNQALESKGTTRPWALQSHYNHPGWYIVWRYMVDPTRLELVTPATSMQCSSQLSYGSASEPATDIHFQVET